MIPAAIAALYFTALGWPISCRVLPRALPPLAFAPLLGWAVHLAVAATILPFTRAWGVVALGMLGAVWALHWRSPAASGVRLATAAVPVASVLACLPAAAILPKHSAGGIVLSGPIFDHAKIAIVDVIARQGLPPINPFWGAGEPHLAYYFWWHMGAGELARLCGVTGWTADAAMTWFTGFTTLLLLAGMGQALGRSVGLIAMPLALVGSVRPLLAPLVRAGWLLPAGGLRGWLNQTSWAPQHVAAAGAVVLAALLLAGLAEAPSLLGVVVLGGVIAAGFGSSAWVGGIVCAVVGPVAAIALAARLPAGRRLGLLLRGAAAACVALVLVAPLLRTEYAANVARGAAPLGFAIYHGFGLAGAASGLGEMIGFPLLLLIGFPVATVLGGWGVVRAWRDAPPLWQVGVLGVGLPSLLVVWCLRSTIDNNDLGWRAVLPALLSVLPFAARSVVALGSAGGWRAAVVVAPLLGVAGTLPTVRDGLRGRATPDAVGFAQEAAMWRAIDRLAAPSERVLSDPQMDNDMTFWPINIGWALLSHRPSCYAGFASAQAFVPLPPAALEATRQEVRGIFAGTESATRLADRLHCDIALLTTRSRAWTHDPFGTDPGWRLLGGGAGWRLYRAVR